MECPHCKKDISVSKRCEDCGWSESQASGGQNQALAPGSVPEVVEAVAGGVGAAIGIANLAGPPAQIEPPAGTADAITADAITGQDDAGQAAGQDNGSNQGEKEDEKVSDAEEVYEGSGRFEAAQINDQIAKDHGF